MKLRLRKSGLNRKLRWGMLLLGALTLGAGLAGFLAPYSPLELHRDYPFAPPTLPSFADSSGKFSLTPVIYALRMADPERRVYEQDRAQPVRLRFFVSGEEHTLFGLIPCRLHLFGVDEPARFFILGTDGLGRDIFSRLLHGARLSLLIAAVAVAISFPLGLMIGGLAGYFGGAIDFVGMRFIELFMALPMLYLVIALRSALPLNLEPEKVVWAMIAVIGLFGWAHVARVVRGLTLSLRERDFVLAAVALGASHWHILRKHFLPHLTGFTLTQAALAAPGYILAEVTLSYLGLGVQEPLPSWGNMLSLTQNIQVLTIHWWNLAPAVAIFFSSLTFYLLAEGLKQHFDPRSPDGEAPTQFLA
jgi:peptide/nickel transport system permease protein